jgi:hypothetical protein
MPWEARVGCPACRVKPRTRCRTLRSRYPLGYVFRDGTPAVGRDTLAHKARYELWCLLWGRSLCQVLTPAEAFPAPAAQVHPMEGIGPS